MKSLREFLCEDLVKERGNPQVPQLYYPTTMDKEIMKDVIDHGTFLNKNDGDFFRKSIRDNDASSIRKRLDVKNSQSVAVYVDDNNNVMYFVCKNKKSAEDIIKDIERFSNACGVF